LCKLNRTDEVAEVLRETLKQDPLDWWARQLRGDDLSSDLQTRLDLAHDYARAGFFEEAIGTLRNTSTVLRDLPDQSWGALPMVHYTLGWLYELTGDGKQARASFKRAAALPGDYCFPARLEEIAILEAAMRANPRDAMAPYYLGNLLYDRRRHREAIQCWEKSAKLNPKFSIVWRNLGIGCFNVSKQPLKARAAYDRAFAANPRDARLLFERDQLWKRLGESPDKRLRMLEKHPDLVALRDDLNVELCALYNQTGQPEKALARLRARNFQPWEGGEGGPLGQWVRSHLALGRITLQNGETGAAISHFHDALQSPFNLGEAKHLLANQSDIHYWLGLALESAGDLATAREHWDIAANFKGDFQEMRVRAFSEMTCYSALALVKLRKKAQAQKLFRNLLSFAREMQKSTAKIDYFATSLPTMLLFDDDLQLRQETMALFLQAQAMLGLGRKAQGNALIKTILRRDPNHAAAADLLAGEAT
jgi:tetratricopeptide (TPR) repeat protein